MNPQAAVHALPIQKSGILSQTQNMTLELPKGNALADNRSLEHVVKARNRSLSCRTRSQPETHPGR